MSCAAPFLDALVVSLSNHGGDRHETASFDGIGRESAWCYRAGLAGTCPMDARHA